MPKFRTAYDRDSVEGITFTEPTLAQQHFKDECDVNNILRKYEATGLVTHVANGTPSYGDFSSVLEFQQAQNILIEAQDAFDALPASLRKRFDNDPAVMLEFIENPDNREEAEKLGLLNKSINISGDSNDVIPPKLSEVEPPKEGSEQLPT
jgi:phage internal scaffolding protein